MKCYIERNEFPIIAIVSMKGRFGKYVEMIGNLCLDYKRDPFFAKMRKGLFKDGKQRFLFGENEKKFINPSKGRVHNPQNGIHSSLFNNIIGEKVHQMVFLEINIL